MTPSGLEGQSCRAPSEDNVYRVGEKGVAPAVPDPVGTGECLGSHESLGQHRGPASAAACRSKHLGLRESSQREDPQGRGPQEGESCPQHELAGRDAYALQGVCGSTACTLCMFKPLGSLGVLQKD